MLAIAAATVVIGWFFNIDIHSLKLWSSSIIIFLTFAYVYTAPLYFKIGGVFVAIFLIATYVSYLFQWPIGPSFIIGLIVVIFILFTYLAI